jgi:hypothetical protein
MPKKITKNRFLFFSDVAIHMLSKSYQIIADVILKYELIFLGTNIFHCYSQEHEKLLSTCERIDGKIS